jgi:hypothetical protein
MPLLRLVVAVGVRGRRCYGLALHVGTLDERRSVMNTVVRPTIPLAVTFILLGWLVITVAAQTTDTKPLPRVYVFTQGIEPGQPAAPDQLARQESVKDLREAPSTTQCVVIVRLRVIGRNYAREFQGESRTWKNAASLVAEVVQRWVNETHDTATRQDARHPFATVQSHVPAGGASGAKGEHIFRVNGDEAGHDGYPVA